MTCSHPVIAEPLSSATCTSAQNSSLELLLTDTTTAVDRPRQAVKPEILGASQSSSRVFYAHGPDFHSAFTAGVDTARSSKAPFALLPHGAGERVVVRAGM
jgi:hypothetical protein